MTTREKEGEIIEERGSSGDGVMTLMKVEIPNGYFRNDSWELTMKKKRTVGGVGRGKREGMR